MMRRSSRPLRMLCMTSLLLATMPHGWAASPAGICPSPGAPGGSRLTWVAPQIGVDGLPMAIVMLQADQPPAGILDWYVQHWKTPGRNAQPIRYTTGAWQVVARRVSGCFETVQAQSADGGGTLAYIGISQLRGVASTPTLGPDIPRLPGTQTLLTMDSQDAARGGQTRLLGLPMSVLAARDYYRQALAGCGWAVEMDHMPAPTQAALMAQRHTEQIEVAFTSVQGKTYALLTVVKN